LVSKCYLEITIPTLSFTESETITANKQNKLSSIQINIDKFTN
jgi:hypothetical protein